MIKEIEIGSTITAKRSTKWIIRGALYKIVGRQMACPYDGMKHYIHKNNVKVAWYEFRFIV